MCRRRRALLRVKHNTGNFFLPAEVGLSKSQLVMASDTDANRLV